MFFAWPNSETAQRVAKSEDARHEGGEVGKGSRIDKGRPGGDYGEAEKG